MRDSMTIESEGISPLLQRTRDKKMFNVFNIAFFILLVFICVHPFYYLIINSISDNTLSAAGRIAVLPRESTGVTMWRSSNRSAWAQPPWSPWDVP